MEQKQSHLEKNEQGDTFFTARVEEKKTEKTE